MIGYHLDGRACTITHIIDAEVRYTTLVITYSIYYLSHNNIVPSGVVYGAHQMINDQSLINLSGWLHDQEMENIGKIKIDYMNHTIKHGEILVFIFFYFR